MVTGMWYCDTSMWFASAVPDDISTVIFIVLLICIGVGGAKLYPAGASAADGEDGAVGCDGGVLGPVDALREDEDWEERRDDVGLRVGGAMVGIDEDGGILLALLGRCESWLYRRTRGDEYCLILRRLIETLGPATKYHPRMIHF